MISSLRFGLFLPIFFLMISYISFGQQPAPGENQASAATDTTAQPQSIASQPSQKPPRTEPYIIEDGGLSIEPMYWLNKAQPTLRGGASATSFGSIDYPGTANPSIGGQVSIPAGRSNTLRLSYFRVQGHSNTTVTQTASIFGETYDPGDYIVANYTLQSAKLSWDYLSYTWDKRPGKIRLKTLYEVQFVTIGSNFYAPYKPVTTDSSGNTDTNSASGSKNLIYPTFGAELTQMIGRHFRWELKGSGFGVPHHGVIWDAEGSLVLRAGPVDLFVGEKAYHFKTSPQADEYFINTLSGVYVGARYYWGRRE